MPRGRSLAIRQRRALPSASNFATVNLAEMRLNFKVSKQPPAIFYALRNRKVVGTLRVPQQVPKQSQAKPANQSLAMEILHVANNLVDACAALRYANRIASVPQHGCFSASAIAKHETTMNELVALVTLILASMGLTVLIAWPQEGLGAWIREKIFRRILPRPLRHVLDCYVCLGFWSGLLLSPLWWWMTEQWWCFAACLMTPAVFWWALRERAE